jgi:hypothetical protein
MRLREVERFVAANDYDATTRSMRGASFRRGADRDCRYGRRTNG